MGDGRGESWCAFRVAGENGLVTLAKDVDVFEGFRAVGVCLAQVEGHVVVEGDAESAGVTVGDKRYEGQHEDWQDG